MADAPVVDILMYHSISDAAGATSIRPEVFSAQMKAIAEAGIPVISLDALVESRRMGALLPPRSIIITFDDAYQDFADTAWPILKQHGFGAMVYVPTDHVGRAESWDGANKPPRRIMDWATVRRLAEEGVEFGSHSVTHSDLTMLADDTLSIELNVSKAEIEDQLGRTIHHFAPPYGMSNDHVVSMAAGIYRTAVGTQLGQVRSADNLNDLPRIEMFYYTSIGRWKAHLSGDGAGYLRKRRFWRTVRRYVPGL
ncbi:MAG: polysaccharide deacetylase family protein [Rhodobacteraceae bacterium]|nr:polysaccharide deacetylase family protein [Paracoccaceae bacterium]